MLPHPAPPPPTTINSASWAAAKSANWTVAANWSPSGVPTISTAATIAIAGKYTVTIAAAATAHSLTINNATASVADNASLTLAGALTLTAGTFTLGAAEVLSGGTLSAGSTGVYVWNGTGNYNATSSGTLSGDTFQGTLNLNATDAGLAISNGFSLTGAGGTGAGVINLTGDDAYLYIQDNETLSNGTLNIGTNTGTSYISFNNTGNPSETLTLGSSFDLVQAGTYAAIGAYPNSYTDSNAAIVNNGTITAAVASGTLTVNAYIGTLTNAGTIALSNNATVDINATNFYNSGTITETCTNTLSEIGNLTIDPSGTFTNTGVINIIGNNVPADFLEAYIGGGTWANQGTINVSKGGDLVLDGTITTATFKSVNLSNGYVEVGGVLENAGTTLAVSQTLALGLAAGAAGGDEDNLDPNASIIGGTITDAAGLLYVYGDGSYLPTDSGTLNGVTYEGTLNLNYLNAGVSIANNLTMSAIGGSGTGVLNDDAQSSYLYIQGSDTISGATINLGSNTGTSYISFYNVNNPVSVLTLAATTDLVQAGTYAAIGAYPSSYTDSNAAIVNNGTITAAVASGTLTVNAYIGTLTNAGTIALSNNATVDINATNFYNSGTITETCTNTLSEIGNLTIDPSGTFTNTGVINIIGNNVPADFLEAYIGGGTWANQGTINVSKGGDLVLDGTITTATFKSVNLSNGYVEVGGVLENAGTTLAVSQTLALGLAAGAAGGDEDNLDPNASIIGGTITDAAGLLYVYGDGSYLPTDSGTLNGVTYEGTLNLNYLNAGVSIANNLTMSAIGGSGTGVLNDDAQSSYLYIQGSDTISGATINLGSNTGTSYISFYNVNNPVSVLTLAATTDLVQTGTYAAISSSYGYGDSNASIINDGTITAAVAGGTLTLNQIIGTFTNNGAINVSSTESMTVDTYSFTNAGTIAETSDGTVDSYLTFGGSYFANTGTINNFAPTNSNDYPSISTNATLGWSNTGTINNNDAFLSIGGGTWTNQGVINNTGTGFITLYGTFSLATFESINNSDGYIGFNGMMINTGTLVVPGPVNGSSAYLLLASGTIMGGVVNDPGGNLSFQSSGTGNPGGYGLSGVTYQGTLNLTSTYEQVGISNGLTLQGANGTGSGTINDTCSNGTIYIENTSTLSGGTLNIGNAANYNYINLYDNGNPSETLTLASNFNITQVGAEAGIEAAPSSYNPGSQTVINDGTINASASSGGTFEIGQYIGTFTNAGNIIVGNGETFIDHAETCGNLSATGTLSGNYEVDGASVLEVYTGLAIAGITAITGTVTLNGAGAEFLAINTSNAQPEIDTDLASVLGSATLNIENGRSFADSGVLADYGTLNLAAGTLSATGVHVASTGKLTGNGTITTSVLNTGTILASGGHLDITGSITGTGAIDIATGASLEIGVGSVATETVNFASGGGTLKLDAPTKFLSVLAGLAAGDIIDLVKTVATSVSTTGNLLTVTTASTTDTFTLNAPLANTHLAFVSDGSAGTNVEVYGYAQASTATPSPIAFGNVHAGSTATQALSLTNTALANGYSEALDASLGGATGAITANGSFTGLAAGASNSASLVIGLNTTATGAETGTAIITLYSDGTGIDGFGQTAIGTQTVNVTGAVYAYAAATLANAGTVTLANTHVGGAASGTLGVTNSAAANGYSEALDATLSGASAGFSASGSFAGLAAGASTGLSIGYTATASGAYTGTASLGLVSDGTGIDGLGTTTLGTDGITITGAAYAYAQASIGTLTFNLGVTHVGAADTTSLSITNTALANGYSEALDALWGTAGTGISVSGSLQGLAAGASNLTSLILALQTTTSGTISASALLNLISDGTNIDGLGTTTLGSQTILVTGIVDNYAVAAFQDPGGPTETGTSTSETINLGSVVQGNAALTLSLGVLNAATGLSDLLQGTIATSGSTTGFVDAGFGTFSGLGAGQGEHSQSVTLTTGTAGTFTETILLTSYGTNASGYDGQLTTETLTITGTVTAAGSTTYVLAVGPNDIVGAAGGDIFQAASGALNSHDSLTGGSGTNVLQLIGGGIFDVGSPAVFANIPTITAYEGQAAKGTLVNTSQIVFLGNETETINVVTGSPASGNTNPETITLYDGNDADTYNLATGADVLYLGTGTDTVNIGGAKNVIHAGGGTATLSATIAGAAASIIGTTTGSTTLNVSTAGTVVLNAADTYLTVNLLAASKLTAGAMGFITVNGGAGTDTIVAGAANDVLIGGKSDALTGFASGGDTFYGASAALNGDKITNWTTGDMIDLTDMNSATLHALSYKTVGTTGTLTVTDGTHTSAIVFESNALTLSDFTVIGSDGHSGTLIGF